MAYRLTVYLFIGFNLLLFTTSYSQNLKKAIKVANSLYEQESFKEALPAYIEVLKIEPGNAEANYKVGILYLRTIHKIKALPYLQKSFGANPAIASDIKFQLATAYQFNHKFKEALNLLKEYKTSINPKELSTIKMVDRRIYECENGIHYLANPVKAQVDNLGSIVNSKFADFAPVITADQSIMVFTSRRPGSTGEKVDENNSYYEDIYISISKDGQWGVPKNIGKPVNNDGHDASIAISPGGTQIFIYKDFNMGDIFVSRLSGGRWSKPEDMGKNINTKYSETSISMTPDSRTVYFTSDREGGFGGFDIYKSEIDKKGKWSPAVNLGKVINTEYAEESPFIHPDGKTLYFSSRGHAGMGDYDIFKTTLQDDGTWSAPENLGYPINTADDDIYFVMSADNRNGYYSSERENGLGEKDIYIISMPKPAEAVAVNLKTKEAPMPGLRNITPIATVASFNPITILKGTVKDAVTKQFLEAELTLTDNEKNEVISQITSNQENGSFLIVLPSGKNYGLTIQKTGYLFHSENFDIPLSKNYQEINKDIELKKVEVGTKIVLRNIFFDFDKSTLRPTSTNELDRLVKLMVDMPKLKIEISGHTDNKGGAEYNKQLSNSRASSVVDYLIKHGIDKGRLTFAGYGLDRPIATNETSEGRQLNRRTEFEVMAD